jgi:hypothetical protein
MNRWLVVTVGALVLLITGVGALLLWNQASRPSWVEHRGKSLIVHGRGSAAELGYLAGGRYELTIDQNDDGCVDSLSLVGEDGFEWFQIDPHLVNYKDFAKTREIPGQRYQMQVAALVHGGLGPRMTPRPIRDCTWVFELAPA